MFCPACSSEEVGVFGVLGYLKWFLCRACGMQFSRKIRKRKLRKRAA